MKKKLLINLIFLSLLLTSMVMFAGETLIAYSNFAVIQSNVSQRSNGFLIVPTTNFAVQDSLVTSSPMNWYRYHTAESYSLQAFLDSYVGKLLIFKFQDGSIKTLKLISTKPEVLQDPYDGTIYLSPAGEYLFPSSISVDGRNYFIVSTNSTQLRYHYISTNIGWKAFYDLDMSSSILKAKILLWNKTDTSFKDFHLLMVAGKQFENFQRTENYSKTLALSSAPPSEGQFFGSYQGYKIHDFGNVKSLKSHSKLFLSLFSKKINFERINVSYNPSDNFSKALQAVKIKHDFPIPTGTMSLYDEYEGAACYLGQFNVPDSPASSTIEIPYGENFDLEVKAVKTYHSMISKNTFVDSYKVEVANRSDKTQGVWIYKYVPQSSNITSNDLNIERVSASKIRFYVEVKAHSEGNFEYTLQASY
jgi:hypothetical protein